MVSLGSKEVIAWIAVVTSNADVIAQSEAKCNLLHYKCY